MHAYMQLCLCFLKENKWKLLLISSQLYEQLSIRPMAYFLQNHELSLNLTSKHDCVCKNCNFSRDSDTRRAERRTREQYKLSNISRKKKYDCCCCCCCCCCKPRTSLPDHFDALGGNPTRFYVERCRVKFFAQLKNFRKLFSCENRDFREIIFQPYRRKFDFFLRVRVEHAQI